MSSLQLFPDVLDGSTLTERVTTSLALPVGVEGEMANDGTADVGTVYSVSRQSEANMLFGASSTLAALVNYLLDRGAGPVIAIASTSGTTPLLADRQAAWQTLETNKTVRLRLTDSTAQATHVALAVSCDNAHLLNNMQIGIGGMASGTSKAALITAAGAIASKRFVLVGPGVYDEAGTLVSGAFAAASVAARVAQNSDPSDDLDTAPLPKLTGIEKDVTGNDVFRQIVVGGVVQNDFEDLLQGGASPLMPGFNGGVAISHLRMTYTADSGAWDSLMTRIIIDQLFILVRNYAFQFNQLRQGNTPTTRARLASGVDALLKANVDIILPVDLGDGTTGYGVVVTASADERQMIVSYQGEVVRGTSTILVAPSFTIPV